MKPQQQALAEYLERQVEQNLNNGKDFKPFLVKSIDSNAIRPLTVEGIQADNIALIRDNYINPSRKSKRIPLAILIGSWTVTLGFSAYSIYALFEEGAELNQEVSWIDGVTGPIASLIACYLYMQYYRTIPTADYEKDGASLRNISKLDAARILVPMLIIVAPNLLLLDPIIEALGPDYIYAHLAKHIFYILSTTAAIEVAVYMQALEESEIIQYSMLPSVVELKAASTSPELQELHKKLFTVVEKALGKMDAPHELKPTPRDRTEYYKEVQAVVSSKLHVLEGGSKAEFQKHVLERLGFVLLHRECELTYAPSMTIFSNALFTAVNACKPLLIECELTNEMLDLIIQVNSEFSQNIIKKGKELADEGRNNDVYTSMPKQIVKYCFGDNKFNCDNRQVTWTRPYVIGNGGQSKCVTDKHEDDYFKRTPSHYQDSVIAIPTVNIETSPMRTAGATKARDMVGPLTELAQFSGTHVIPVKLCLNQKRRLQIFRNIDKNTALDFEVDAAIMDNIDAGERPVGYVEMLQRQAITTVLRQLRARSVLSHLNL